MILTTHEEIDALCYMAGYVVSRHAKKIQKIMKLAECDITQITKKITEGYDKRYQSQLYM